MKPNKKRKALIKRRGESRRDEGTMPARGAIAAFALVLAAGAIALAFFGYSRLREIWIEQCVIDDVASQVQIITGSQVKPGVILDGFGLTNGANLAEIDFKARREDLLAKIPNIKTLAIERHMPSSVVITVGERDPVARMGLKGVKALSGRVVDEEGVVFVRRVGTSTLPIIREALQPGTTVGKRLSGRARAALRLIMLCADEEFSSLNLLEIDLASRDSLVMVLGNYQRVRIAWDGMDDDSPASGAAALYRQLSELVKAIKTGIGSRALVWNATQPGRVTADTKEPIP